MQLAPAGRAIRQAVHSRTLARAVVVVVALTIGFAGIAVPTVDAHNVTHLCSIFEASTPYKPAGTSVVRAYGDATCTSRAYEVRMWIKIYRSTDGGANWAEWANGPYDKDGNALYHCNNCSYESVTLSKACSGTAQYYSYVYMSYYDTRDGFWHSFRRWSGYERTIAC